jgi:hypothetical protein
MTERTSPGWDDSCCRPGPDLPCSICGLADGGRIGISRATGTPVCERCRKRWITCSRCGTGAPLKGGTLREPLCARCLNPDPAFWKRCASCQQTWQLATADCTRCSLDRKLRQAFTPPGGGTAPELDRLRQALVRVDRPDLMLDWLKGPGVRRTLQDVAARRIITHEALDTLPQGRTLVHVRSMLVAAGALPARDERLTALERRVSQVAAGHADPGHRRALHGYGLWHHTTFAACAAASTAGPPPASRPRTCTTRSPPPRRSWTGSPHAG